MKLALALVVLTSGPLATFAYENDNPGAAPSDNWELVYEHKIPKKAGKNEEGGTGWETRDDIPYKQDFCDNFANTPFGKVGYEMILDDTTVWAEFNAPDNMDACKAGLPVDWIFDTPITGLTVRVEPDDGTFNTPELAINGGTGSIEFWSNCYGVGVDGSWNYDDYPRNDLVDCYGSMQIHHSTGTVLSYNAWSGGTTSQRKTEMGIGNCPAGDSRWSLCHPDWTFSQNSNQFKVRYLNVYLKTTMGAPTASPTLEPTMKPTYSHPCADGKMAVVTQDGSCVSLDSIMGGMSGLAAQAISCTAGQVEDMTTNPATCLNLCSAQPLDSNCVKVEGDGCVALKDVVVELKTTVAGFDSVEAFDESAQSDFKDNVAAASSLIASADDVVILAVTEVVRRRALLSVSLDIDYTVTVSVEDESTGAVEIANDITTTGPGATSVESTTLLGGGGTGAICFSGDSTVTLESGDKTAFKDLEVGDVILSADREGNISATKVLFLPHKTNTIRRNFDEIETKRGKKIQMTPNHLLPLCDGSLVTARSLEEGDCVMTTNGADVVIKTKESIEGRGIYTAVTENEFLVVDGIVASPFALAHGIAHSFFNRTDVAEWCNDNSHLVSYAEDEEIKDMISRRRRLTSDSDGCVDLMKILFENYKDEGVGWGTNGWGYRNFKTIFGN